LNINVRKNTISDVTKDFKRTLWYLGAFSAALNTLLLAQPVYMLQVYDRVLPSHSTDTLLFLSLIIGLALLVSGLLETVRTILSNRAAARFDVGLSELALRTVVRNGTAAGGNTQPLRDIAALRSLISSKALLAVLDLPFAVVFTGIMYLIHPALFVMTLGGAVILALIAIFNQRALARLAKEHGDHSISAGARAENIARSADSVVAMGMLSNAIDSWGAEHARSLASADRSGTINAWFAGLSKFLRLGLQTGILGYGALLVLEGQMTAGMIFAASLISGRALQPIDQIIASWRQLVAGQEAWKRVSSFLEKADRRTEYTRLPDPDGAIEVREVSQPNLIDPARPPILSRISFRIEPGESVAMLGTSGSGKSTLARMLVGAVAPKAGLIRIDGHDIANWDPEILGTHVGYLAQEVELLPGTIAQNIARFDHAASDEAIIEAARAAHAEDLIKRLPRGYDTLIGPGGIQISGGERQRVGLARAFYGSPRILVLDEPNASLDRVGEKALMRALAEAKNRKVTVVVITQREMVLAGVDKIMRIQNGVLLEFDKRDTVLSRHSYALPGGVRQEAGEGRQ
jgi:PrtD family type I secretion system ABC transporter